MKSSKENVDKIIEIFTKLKNEHKIKAPESDYYFWINKKSPEEFLDFMDNISSQLTKTQIAKAKDVTAKEGAETIYEDDTWLVLKINTYYAAAKYGKNTK